MARAAETKWPLQHGLNRRLSVCPHACNPKKGRLFSFYFPCPAHGGHYFFDPRILPIISLCGAAHLPRARFLSSKRHEMKRDGNIKIWRKKAPTSALWRFSGVELQCDDEEEDELSSRLAAEATSRSSRSSSGAPSAMLVQRGTDALSSGRAADDGVDGEVEAVKPLPHPLSPETLIFELRSVKMKFICQFSFFFNCFCLFICIFFVLGLRNLYEDLLFGKENVVRSFVQFEI